MIDNETVQIITLFKKKFPNIKTIRLTEKMIYWFDEDQIFTDTLIKYLKEKEGFIIIPIEN